METIFVISGVIGIILFLFFLFAVYTSIKENEKTAALRLAIVSIILPLPFFIPIFFEFPLKNELSIVLLIVFSVLIIILFLPIRGNKIENDVPTKRIDERDTMFSRNELKHGTDRFEEYYKDNPEKKILDEKFRKRPGLLKQGSTQYNPFHFSAADASFETIANLKVMVDGEHSIKPIKIRTSEITNFIKSWSKKLGAVGLWNY